MKQEYKQPVKLKLRKIHGQSENIYKFNICTKTYSNIILNNNLDEYPDNLNTIKYEQTQSIP